MADLYRKSSLEKLSNPDQLDKMVKISSPLSWLVLVAIFLVILVTLAWSFLGTLPTIETVNGIVVSSNNVNAIYSQWVGTIEKCYKEEGKNIEKGERKNEKRRNNKNKENLYHRSGCRTLRSLYTRCKNVRA